MTDYAELFAILPLDRAMPKLLAGTPGPAEAIEWVNSAVASPSMKAVLWLYVDDVEQAHIIVQDLHTPTAAHLHAIVHRREGDYSNSKYWFRQAVHHPVAKSVPGYAPVEFVEQAEEAAATSPSELLALQRAEWRALFDYVEQEGL